MFFTSKIRLVIHGPSPTGGWLPRASTTKRVMLLSAAGAAARVAEMADPRIAALAPPRAAELYGLKLLAEDPAHRLVQGGGDVLHLEDQAGHPRPLADGRLVAARRDGVLLRRGWAAG
jgi:hypothetical protein